jgi:hypothetical protein
MTSSAREAGAMPAATRTATLVVTTIFEAEALDGYYENFKRFGHLDQVEVIVIPDRKTPAATYERARRLTAQGLKTLCPSLEEQELYLRRVGFSPELIPYNSDNRRNIGYLMALGSGRDFLISIDDDNYVAADEDAFAAHSVVCDGAREWVQTSSPTGFFNICSLLELERPGPVYARGYPYFARHKGEVPASLTGPAEVHINAGLWTLDPDVDGITWLVANPHVTGFQGESVVLAPDTWSPVNTQNTALRREAIPAYYFVRMGYPLAGMPIDRYGDIFSGYLVQACAEHLGGAVRAGTPVAEHRRNSHNYMKDAANELACIMVLEDLLPWLQGVRLSGSTYEEAYACLSREIEEAVECMRGPIWTDSTRGYFHQMAFCMRAWLSACKRLQG